MSTINELSMRLALLNQDYYDAVMQALIAREQVGIAKYGVTVDRTDLSRDQWMQQGMEELLDALMYFARAGRWEVIPIIYDIIHTILYIEAKDLYEKAGDACFAATRKMDG